MQDLKSPLCELYFNQFFFAVVHIAEGILGKVHPNKRDTERYVFLLDGLLICCKQVIIALYLLTSFWLMKKKKNRRLGKQTGGIADWSTNCLKDRLILPTD